MSSEIKGCSTQEFLLADNIPKNLTDTDDVHYVPRSYDQQAKAPGDWYGNRFVQQVNFSGAGCLGVKMFKRLGAVLFQKWNKNKRVHQKTPRCGRSILRP